MKSFAVLILAAGILVSVLARAQGVNQGPERKDLSHASVIKDCGAASVSIVCGLLGASHVEFANAKQVVDPDGDGLASMLDLVNGLSSFGFEAQAVQSKELRVPEGVNILHVSASDKSSGEDHFIVSQELPQGQYQFYCPPLGVKTGDSTALEGMWSGRYVHVELPSRRRLWVGVAVVVGGVALGVGASMLKGRAKSAAEFGNA